jgi:hypothetical protein
MGHNLCGRQGLCERSAGLLHNTAGRRTGLLFEKKLPSQGLPLGIQMLRELQPADPRRLLQAKRCGGLYWGRL